MIRPIVAYGDPVLRSKCANIDQNHQDLSTLIDDMFETMYAANGVGLAAPQIGLSLRLFVVDASPFADDPELSAQQANALQDFKKVFINPEIIEETGVSKPFNEGCLSIPDIREDVMRQEHVFIRFFDENFEEQELHLDGLAARVVQHEYDHIEGILFTDKLSPIKKRLLKNKLNAISRGQVNADYKMRFPAKTKNR